VRWQGFSPAWDSWVRRANLCQAPIRYPWHAGQEIPAEVQLKK